MFTARLGGVHRRSPLVRTTNLASGALTAVDWDWSDMREEYRAELADVTRVLVEMAEGVRTAMRRATSALLNADRTGAEEVLAADAEIDDRYRRVEEKVYDLLAR